MNKRRTVEYLIKRVREELRAEGPDGAGYSDFIIIDALNAGLDELSSIFTIRDTAVFNTTASQQSYDLEEILDVEIFKIIRVAYDGNVMKGTVIDEYLDKDVKDEGPVRTWFLWGNELTLVGEVEADKEVTLWVNRGPRFLRDKDDVPDTPRYMDEALVAFAIAVCYRESRDYERANFHYRIFINQKREMVRRTIPQGHRDHLPVMQDQYSKSFQGNKKFYRRGE